MRSAHEDCFHVEVPRSQLDVPAEGGVGEVDPSVGQEQPADLRRGGRRGGAEVTRAIQF